MADPFEVRMRFTSQLQHLNASTSSALKAAHYALKHAAYSDDLHSCILEQLERNNMNNRANIMYFLPSLCDTAKAQNEMAYVRMMERDILRIVDLVAPDDGSGAANVKVVRKVLGGLRGKGFLLPQTVVELEECIVGRDAGVSSPPREGFALPNNTSAATITAPTSTAVAGDLPQQTTSNGDAPLPPTVRSTPHSTTRDPFPHPGIRLDKRQIEQRIEEDRERHKRARETLWAILQEGGSLGEDAEFEKLWEEMLGEVGEDEFVLAREEGEGRGWGLEFEEV